MCERYDEYAVEQEYARVVAVAKQYGTRGPDKEKTMAQIRQALSQQTVVQRRTARPARGAKPAPPAGAGADDPEAEADDPEPEPEQLDLALVYDRKRFLMLCFSRWYEDKCRKKKLHFAFDFKSHILVFFGSSMSP